MNESGSRLQPLKKLERPQPRTIQPTEETDFPQASVEQLAARTETERKQQEWQATKNFVLLQAEANRINDGLNIILNLETRKGVPPEKLRSPNLKEATRVLSEWQSAFPRKDPVELIADIQARMRNNLGREVANMTASGMEVPTGVKFDALEDYITSLPIAERILKGLEEQQLENPPASRDRARAQEYMAQYGIRTPAEGIERLMSVMQRKRAIVQRLGIQIP